MSIPCELPSRSAFAVIERTLAWGEREDLHWLFAHYGNRRLADWVRRFGSRCLPRRRMRFWLVFFGTSDYQRRERLWPH